MNIVVLNGSPGGKKSFTIQYMFYLEKRFPHHSFTTLHVAKEIKRLDRSHDRLEQVLEQVRKADLVIWDFPVYYFLVPAQLVRFIEILFESNTIGAFCDKYTAAFSTSRHFHDHSAHTYIRAVCEDLGMKYVDFYSAEMEDLTIEDERENFLRFARRTFNHVEKKRPVARRFAPISDEATKTPEFISPSNDLVEEKSSGKILLVTDAASDDANLNRMVDHFIRKTAAPIDVININDVNIKGGCLGCFKCCSDGECVYRDDYDTLSQRILEAKIVVYALKIGHRYFTSTFKRSLDRHFSHGHRPVTAGQHVGFIVSGPLRQLPNLEQIMLSMCEVGRTPCSGIVTDEYEDSSIVASLLDELGHQLLEDLESDYQRPWTFLGKGGHMVFRDLVFEAGGVLREDFDHYKEHGLFDYPHTKYKNLAKQAFIRLVSKFPAPGSRAGSDAKKEVLSPLREIVAQADRS